MKLPLESFFHCIQKLAGEGQQLPEILQADMGLCYRLCYFVSIPLKGVVTKT